MFCFHVSLLLLSLIILSCPRTQKEFSQHQPDLVLDITVYNTGILCSTVQSFSLDTWQYNGFHILIHLYYALYSKRLLFSFDSCRNWGTQKSVAQNSLESWGLKPGFLSSSVSHYVVCMNRWLCHASAENPSCLEVHNLCRFWRAACQRKQKSACVTKNWRPRKGTKKKKSFLPVDPGIKTEYWTVIPWKTEYWTDILLGSRYVWL